MQDTKKLLIPLAIILLQLMLTLCLPSCTRTVEKVVDHHTTDTLIQVRTRIDSTFLHDSVMVDRYVKGDTVFVVKDRYKTLYKYLLHTDTLHVTHTDTLLQTRTITKEVAKPTPWYRSALQWAGVLAIVGGVLWVLWKLYLKPRFF